MDFLKGLSPSELTGIRELQRRDLLQRASIYVTMAGDNTSIDNYGNVLNVDSKIAQIIYFSILFSENGIVQNLPKRVDNTDFSDIAAKVLF